MKRVRLILSLAVLGLAGLFVAKERTAAKLAESRLADLRRSRADLDAAIRGRRLRSGPTGPAAAAAAEPALASDRPIDPAGTSDAASDGNPDRAKLRAQYLLSYRAGLDASMALLFAKLHLTPAQADALKDLLAQREANNLRIDDLTQAAGLEDSSDDPALNALDDRLSDANKAAMQQLLGHQGERTVHAFLLEQPVMPTLEMISGDAAAAGQPLSPDQAEGLLDLLSSASQHSASGRVIRDSVDWEQVAARGPAVLSPAQMTFVQQAQAEVEATDRVRRMVVALNRQPAPLGP